MKPTFIRRIRRRNIATHDGNFFKKESSQEQGFSAEAIHDGFFQPQATIQRTTDDPQKEQDDKQLQRKENGAGAVGKTTSSFVGSLGTNGVALPKQTQHFFAARMGYDFSQVKLHTDSTAAKSAGEINAKAYTIGNHIVFNEGQFSPATETGRKLLAHELAHVVQQNSQTLHREISTPLPKDATINQRTGVASFPINDVNVVVEPDEKLKKDSTIWMGDEYAIDATDAETVFNLRQHVSYNTTDDKVSKVTVHYTFYIKTLYGKSSDKKSDSGYGRGTTEDDKKNKNTSLQFHESRHGQDFQDYLSQNPLPKFDLALPATMDDYNTALSDFNDKVTAYSDAVKAYSYKNTDMVGTPKS